MKITLDFPGEFVERLADALAERLQPQLVDAKGAASLGLSRAEFRRAIRRGELVGHRSGRAYVSRRADVLAYVERHRVAPEPKAAERRDLDPIEKGLAAGRLRVLRGGGRR